jgi:Zn-finger nucleic acid-binding protein
MPLKITVSQKTQYTGEDTMKCPVCTGIDLKIAERQGLEIDYCPECRGVWLDRGELDKIIERSVTVPSAELQRQQPAYSPQQQQQHGKTHHDEHGYSQNGYHKKKNWLSEIFD